MPTPEPGAARDSDRPETTGPFAPGTVAPGAGRFLKLPPVGLRQLVRLWWGKLRRALLGRVLKGFTRRRHALRSGHCLRCGACCQLGRVCPSLVVEPSGLTMCLKYNLPRDPTCELFPTTASDLLDRNLILPGTKCGYAFSDGEEGGC